MLLDDVAYGRTGEKIKEKTRPWLGLLQIIFRVTSPTEQVFCVRAVYPSMKVLLVFQAEAHVCLSGIWCYMVDTIAVLTCS